jgi:FtsH-binding integral membrane protein
MKKIIILLMIVAFFIAFNEQNKAKPNVIITVISVVVFMLGMMKLSAKIPPKNNDDYEEKI